MKKKRISLLHLSRKSHVYSKIAISLFLIILIVFLAIWAISRSFYSSNGNSENLTKIIRTMVPNAADVPEFDHLNTVYDPHIFDTGSYLVYFGHLSNRKAEEMANYFSNLPAAYHFDQKHTENLPKPVQQFVNSGFFLTTPEFITKQQTAAYLIYDAGIKYAKKPTDNGTLEYIVFYNDGNVGLEEYGSWQGVYWVRYNW